MKRHRQFAALTLILAGSLACLPHRPTEREAERLDRTVLTEKDFADLHVETAYEAVEALRSNWLHERGTLTLTGTPSVVLVYLDNVKFGPVETLRTLPLHRVSSMRRLDGVEAQARYGIGHASGVIEVETWTMSKSLPAQRDISGDVIVIENDSPYSRAATGFPLVANAVAAPIVGSASDFKGVTRAINDLRMDVGRVTGKAPTVSMDVPSDARQIVLVGTLGKSPLIDKLVQGGKLSAAGVTGKWETYVRQVVLNPMPGVDQALVIAGSDKRGTIYGIYDVSSQIGVSPWYYWADVPTRHQDELYIPVARFTQGEPAVKYRGIFINDEAPAFSGWAREKFGGVNSKVYTKMFELILRMKGNYLWPAMWNNAFADDDSLSAILADEYGIVMGTSHHEPMTRAQKEWTRYGKGAWDYGINDTTLRAFWRKGIERMGTRENIVTLGMRGDGDRPMTTNGGSNVELLEKIVADQRKILADVTGKDPAKTPTLWALYKEVQDYYDKGMRVPDDVTLLFSDDNWGNIRRLPNEAERKHSGGYGIYYHFDYVGGPRNYKWINTNPIARVWEQMNLANQYGANRIWIVNTGDLKPMEFPTQFFLDFAWNPTRWPAERLPEYAKQWAEQQFGPAHSGEIAEVITKYLKYAGRRKPEMLLPETYSLSNYREAERIVEEYTALQKEAERLNDAMPADARDAFFELVLHPVQAAATVNEMYVTIAKNHMYAFQQRAATNDLADRARALFERDAALSNQFNAQIAGGKWAHMMDQTHIGYTNWQEPPRDQMPQVTVLRVPEGSELGVWYEGQASGLPVFGPPPGGGAGRAGGTGASAAGGGRAGGFGGGFARQEPALPEFDPYNRQSYFIDVYNKRSTPFDYTISAAQPFVTISQPAGKVEKETRVYVSVDWSKAPSGTTKVPLTVSGAGTNVTVQAIVNNPTQLKREDVDGFVESNDYVSMEAEHFSRAVSSPTVQWLRVPDLGRTGSAMTSTPVNVKSQSLAATSARLEYRMFLFDSGTVTLRTYFSPTLNFTGAPESLRFAVSIDDEAPQTLRMVADSTNRMWEQSVGDQIVTMTSKHMIAKPGLHVLKYWMIDPGLVLQKLVVDAGGVKPSYLGPPESYRATKSAAGKK
ncbi:MAG: glycosyl hydrolase 115 family protein [Gemmatimonadota bacterium]